MMDIRHCQEGVLNKSGSWEVWRRCSRKATKAILAPTYPPDGTVFIVGQYCTQHARILAAKGLRANWTMMDIDAICQELKAERADA